MRFLIATIACLALTSSVSAQDWNDASYITDDFDIFGRQVEPTSLPVQTPIQELPIKAMPVKESPIKAPVQEQPIKAPVQQFPIKESVQQKEEKPQTIMLQPIVLMPKKRLPATKTLNFDIDRAMAYRVSPKISAENSRSVDVSFAPILNAKMRNILTTADLPQRVVRVRSPQIQSVKSPQQFQARFQSPQQQQYQTQYQYQEPQFTGLQDVSASSGLRENVASNQYQFLNEEVMSPRSYQFTSGDNQYQGENIEGVQQPSRYQSFQ